MQLLQRVIEIYNKKDNKEQIRKRYWYDYSIQCMNVICIALTTVGAIKIFSFIKINFSL
jgi:hypothetical protein